MSVLDNGGAITHARAAACELIVIAEPVRLRRQIASVLEAAGSPAEAIARPQALAEYVVGAATIVIFACDVDRPAEMTALRRLRRDNREPAIVVISPQSTATAVRRTLDAGADALVFEPEIPLALVASVRAVESGQSVVPRRLRAGVERPNLSHRERQVLALVCEGRTNAEIADALFLAESTIKSHMASIFTKLGVHSRKEAGAAFLDLHPELAGRETETELDLEEMQA
ncbi:MAG: response regulator transcription factor [Actinobacteria bacterium]|nr:response regulator transcription factor [Actinomycetota bacterium]